MEEKIVAENAFKADDLSPFPYSSYPLALIMHCEKLVSYVLNKTSVLNHQEFTPPYIRHLLARQNLTLRTPTNVNECVLELHRLMNSSHDTNSAPLKKAQPIFGIQEHSSSLIIFVFLIGLVSIISIIGNLCLAKVLYSKRHRLLQTDRIVLCLALSELCLVLIDSPTEIYRFLSYSFSQTWLCRFHTFLEAFLSSCIIFYHLLGAFDRFVYIHGHANSYVSSWSKWCRRASTKSGSIILLILPVLCSLPIAACNLFHAHVFTTSLNMKICIVQYTHGFLISLLIFFYIVPLLLTFFLHAKLIHFIKSKHRRHYLAITKSNILPMKRYTLSETQLIFNKQRVLQRENIFNPNQDIRRQVLTGMATRRSLNTSNTATKGNTAGTVMTTSTTAAQQAQQIPRAAQNCGNVSLLSRSSTGTVPGSVQLPITFYKINSQANANANRTVLLLVLLLSFYVLCWAPYNIYTWKHAYQLISTDHNQSLSNRAAIALTLNQTSPNSASLLVHQYHSDLRRIIFINYSLYLLSMISMCFSFIFYFSLNKQARQELKRLIRCICPCFNCEKRSSRRETLQKATPDRFRVQRQQPRENPFDELPASKNQHRLKMHKYTAHAEAIPPTPLLIDSQKYVKYATASPPRVKKTASKRQIFTYGCHVECCM